MAKMGKDRDLRAENKVRNSGLGKGNANRGQMAGEDVSPQEVYGEKCKVSLQPGFVIL